MKKKTMSQLYMLFAILIIVLLLAIYLKPGIFNIQNKFPNIIGTQTGSTIDLNQPDNGFYSVILSLNPTIMCAGESTLGRIQTDIPNGFCSIYMNPGTGWIHLANVVLDANGDYMDRQIVNTPGSVDFRAVCCDAQMNCKISNVVNLLVQACPNNDDDYDPCEGYEYSFPDMSADECVDKAYSTCIFYGMDYEWMYNQDTGQCCFNCKDYPGAIGTVFVTSQKWTGAMGGIAGADAKCQLWAGYGGLSGTWKAIISDTTTSASSRVPNTVFKLLNGNTVANSKVDLFDASILTAINVDETGNKVADSDVWTGSFEDGLPVADLYSTCHDWGWVSEGYYGIKGNTYTNDGKWIHDGAIPCSQTARLYCVRVG